MIEARKLTTVEQLARMFNLCKKEEEGGAK